jgi:phosphoribosylformimino-5-aminoimidazole carboxamide ribotide isomerase
MEIWAAIDLHRGQVVSLRKGRPEASTLWSNDPLKIAERWESEGAHGLHVVDLDATLGVGNNRTLVASIFHQAKIPVEVGGGIRSFNDIKSWVSSGADRVVLGTLAYEKPSELHGIIKTLGAERIVVAMDYRNDFVVTRGWTREFDLNIIDAAKNLQASGIETVLATATELDGIAKGPDLDTLRRIRKSTRMNILASGGVRTATDVHELQEIGVQGVIVGRALYEGTLRLSDVN